MNTNHARKWEPLSTPQVPKQDEQVTVKVRKQSWITKGEKVLYSIIGLSLIIASVFIVAYSSSTDTLNRELLTLEQTVQNQAAENQELLYKVESLSEPARIINIAEKHGLKIQNAEVKQAQAFNNN